MFESEKFFKDKINWDFFNLFRDLHLAYENDSKIVSRATIFSPATYNMLSWINIYSKNDGMDFPWNGSKWLVDEIYHKYINIIMEIYKKDGLTYSFSLYSNKLSYENLENITIDILNRCKEIYNIEYHYFMHVDKISGNSKLSSRDCIEVNGEYHKEVSIYVNLK